MMLGLQQDKCVVPLHYRFESGRMRSGNGFEGRKKRKVCVSVCSLCVGLCWLSVHISCLVEVSSMIRLESDEKGQCL